MGCSRSKTEFPCVPNLLGATICWLTTSPLVLPSLSRASNAILSSTRPREGPQSTQLRRSRQVSRTAGVGQTLPSDAPSANDRSRTVSGSSSLRSRASAQREKEGNVIGSNFLDERGPITGVGPITVHPASQNQTIGR